MEPSPKKTVIVLSLLVIFSLIVMTIVLVVVLSRKGNELVEEKEPNWVLWVRYESIDFTKPTCGQDYDLISTFPNSAKCEQAKEDLWKRKYRMIADTLKSKENKERFHLSEEECCEINTFVDKEWFTSSRYFCLPDNINPQEWGK